MGKTTWTSRTIWFFVLFAAANVAGLFGFADWTPTTDMVEISNTIVAVIGIALRYLTTEPIVSA